MKGKFKLLGHIGLVLFVLSALMLTLAPVAQAATAVTNVWVQFTESPYNANHASTAVATGFTMHFTPATAMKRGVDTITVWFPDGSTAMGPEAFSLTSSNTTAANYKVDRDGEASTYSATACTSAAVLSTSGYRITVTTPVDLDAASVCSLQIMAAAEVKTSVSESHDPYYIKVYTSKDTTPVASDGFDLDASSPGAASLSLSPDTAGLAGQYTFTIDNEHETQLTAAAEDTITFIFPYGTTMPSSIAADKVSISSDTGASYSTSTTDAIVNQKARMVTVRTPITLAVSATKNLVRFSTGAGILNPQRVGNANYTDCYVSTSQDEKRVVLTTGYNVTAGTPVKLAFDNDNYPTDAYSDSATMIDMKSDVLYVELQDTYGNVKDLTGTEPTVSFGSSSGTGIFFSPQGTQTSTKLLASGLASVYYRDSAAGTVTLTVSHASYTSGTWTMTIAPGVGLYDSSNNLIKTYAPSSTAFATEGTTVHSGDYIQNAIDASVTGDTVKLGVGIYEVDTVISVSAKITLTSANGAAYTTLKPYSDNVHAIQVTVTGTATNPVIISGLTFDRPRAGVEFDAAVMNSTGDYMTVQNCVFNYVIPDHNTSNEAVVWVSARTVAVTSCTISNNTFSNCVGFNAISGGRAGSIVFDSGNSYYNITGVTVSGNTLTDCNDYGISIGSHPATHTDHQNKATFSNNTITNGYSSIDLAGDCFLVSVTGNTITNGYNYGILIEGLTTSVTEGNQSITIKNNTITGTACAGGTSEAAIYIPDEATASIVTIQYNDITGTNGYSIKAGNAAGSAGFDCKYNWFNSATGPYYSALTGATVTKSNPNGTGDKVSDYVTYYPWLYKSRADVVADNASYQACTMKLVVGWNTLSTPVKLIDTADAISELITSGMTIGYYYDATGWHQITTYVLNPCDAVYVKMSAVTYVLLKFDTKEFSAPSKALNAGWNLISLAYLDSSGKHADDAVASVALTAAGLPGYSQVVSPSLNATQTNMFGVAGSSWAVSYGETTTTSMYAGLGYWIYMQNAATLAGFEITPIAPDLD